MEEYWLNKNVEEENEGVLRPTDSSIVYNVKKKYNFH